MKMLLTITLIFSALLLQPAYASVIPKSPISTIAQPKPYDDFFKLKPHDWEQKTGRRLNFFQQLQFRAAQLVLRKKAKYNQSITEKQIKLGKWSMILGIGCFVLVFIPILNILALPAAITALVFGIISLKGNNNTKGIVGVITSSVFILLYLIIIALLVALIGSWI